MDKKYRLFSWIVEIWNWLSEGKTVFISLLVLSVIMFTSLCIWPSENHIKWAGFLLQLSGTFIAVTGLLRLREHFNQTPLQGLFYDWLKRFPKWEYRATGALGVGFINGLQGRALGIQWVLDDPNLTIEERFEKVLRNLECLKNGLTENSISLIKLQDDHREHKVKVAEDNKKIEKKFNSELEHTLTGDVLKSLMGFVWLIFGMTMSTLAPELYCFTQQFL